MPRRTARRFLVSGRVQGVGYRHFVLRAGRRLGLSGWTRNLEDGRVEILAEGAGESLEALGAELRAGPPGARVEAIESLDASPGPGLSDFTVRF